jgi:hypothetical protein
MAGIGPLLRKLRSKTRTLPCTAARLLHALSDARDDAASPTRCNGLPPTSETLPIMSNNESALIVPPRPKHLCPVCGTPAYSLGGVHPQCAIQLADQPRVTRLRETKAKATKAKQPAVPRQKTCPKCGLKSQIDRKVCKCGLKFAMR